jgi:hypothetical protein
MSEKFLLILSYNGKENTFEVSDPNKPLAQLMENLKGTGIFNLLTIDPSSTPDNVSPIDYYFGKADASGKPHILWPRIGDEDQFLSDYGVNSGDTLLVLAVPIAG